MLSYFCHQVLETTLLLDILGFLLMIFLFLFLFLLQVTLHVCYFGLDHIQLFMQLFILIAIDVIFL